MEIRSFENLTVKHTQKIASGLKVVIGTSEDLSNLRKIVARKCRIISKVHRIDCQNVLYSTWLHRSEPSWVCHVDRHIRRVEGLAVVNEETCE